MPVGTKWWVAGALILTLVGYSACEGRKEYAEWAVWKADRVRVLAEKDSALHYADSVDAVANRKTVAANRVISAGRSALLSANYLRDSLSRLPTPPDTCLPWLQMTARRADSLQVATDSLLAGIDSLRGANADLRVEVATLKRPIAALTHLVETVPEPCRIWFVPCPTVTGGYGATLAEGRIHTGPSVTAGWQIRF